MGVKYANAKDVLPAELLKEVQKYHIGALWVHDPNNFYQERRQLVLALHEQGSKSSEIAALAGITSRRVNQILAKHREETGVPKKNKKIPTD